MLRRFITTTSDFLLSIFFPQTCLFCNTGSKICCRKCFTEIPQNVNLENNNLSVYYYTIPEINKLIWQMKYHHTGDIAKIFGPILAENLRSKFSANLKHSKHIYLIPIPLNQSDDRLHNHANLLAQEIQKNLPFQSTILNNLLIKNSKQKQSHTKSRMERLENVKNTFSINSNFHLPLQTGIYILVDDVTTSGATINEARKTLATLFKIPEQEILAVTIAH